MSTRKRKSSERVEDAAQLLKKGKPDVDVKDAIATEPALLIGDSTTSTKITTHPMKESSSKDGHETASTCKTIAEKAKPGESSDESESESVSDVQGSDLEESEEQGCEQGSTSEGEGSEEEDREEEDSAEEEGEGDVPTKLKRTLMRYATAEGDASAFMAGVLEYISTQILTSAHQLQEKEGGRTERRIVPQHIQSAIKKNQELVKFCMDVLIGKGAVDAHKYKEVMQDYMKQQRDHGDT